MSAADSPERVGSFSMGYPVGGAAMTAPAIAPAPPAKLDSATKSPERTSTERTQCLEQFMRVEN